MGQRQDREPHPPIAVRVPASTSNLGPGFDCLGLALGLYLDAEVRAGHGDVDAVLFTGSYAAGRALQEAALDQPKKLLALEMGGNNAIVVLGDADLDLAAAEAALSIAVTTGQRCTCAGRLFVHRSAIDAFAQRLVRLLRGVKIGPPLEPGVFMGPLVSQRAFETLARTRERAADAGGERILQVDPELPAPYTGAGLVRFAGLEQGHRLAEHERGRDERGAALLDLGEGRHRRRVVVVFGHQDGVERRRVNERHGHGR